MNWSATHEVRPRRLYQPETQAELEALVASHHKSGAEMLKQVQLKALGSSSMADGILHTALAARQLCQEL